MQNGHLKLRPSASDASSTCCDSPISPIPEQLFENLEARRSQNSHAEVYLGFIVNTRSLRRRNRSARLSYCLWAPAQTQDYEDEECVAYNNWAVSQLHLARQLPTKMKLAGVPLSDAWGMTDKYVGLRPWLADSESSSPIPAGSVESYESGDSVSTKTEAAGSHSVSLESLQRSRSSVLSRRSLLCDPEVAAPDGFWKDVGSQLEPYQKNTGELAPSRSISESLESSPAHSWSVEDLSEGELSFDGDHVDTNVLLPWDI